MQFRILLLLITCAIISSCKKNDELIIQNDLKRVETISADALPGGGTKFSGKLDLNEKFVNHGFIIGLTTSITDSTNRKIVIGKPTSAEFSSKLYNALDSGRTYYYTAYALKGDSVITGETKSFIAKAAGIPSISKILPEKPCLEDTIEVILSAFDIKKPLVQFMVTSNNKTTITDAKIVGFKDSVIKCIVPGNYVNNNFIKVSDEGSHISFTKRLNLATPVITGFTNNKSFGDTIEIYGENFDNNMDRVKVAIYNQDIKLISTSRTKITAVLRDEYLTDPFQFTVTAQTQTITSSQPYTLADPVITNLPNVIYQGEIVTLTGKNFSPKMYTNKVYINDYECYVTETGKGYIKFQVYRGPYESNQVRITLKFYNHQVSKNVTLGNKWLLKGISVPFSTYYNAKALVINNEAFVITQQSNFQSSGNPPFSLFKFNPDNYGDWKKASTPLKYMYAAAAGKTKAFFLGGDNYGIVSCYTPSTQQWSTLPALPQANFETIFTINDDVYISGGIYGNAVEASVYVLKSGSDSWKRLNNFPGYAMNFRVGAVTINGKVYLSAHKSGFTFGRDLWEYTPLTDSWIKKHDAPEISVISSFTDGKSFYYLGEDYQNNSTEHCWKYNPQTDTWTDTGVVSGFQRSSVFAFMLGNTAFAGGGRWASTNIEMTDLYRADNFGN